MFNPKSKRPRRRGGVRLRRRPRQLLTPYPGDSTNPRGHRDEIKSFSTGVLNQAVFSGTVGQYLLDLTAVAQGNSGAQRTGDHLFATHLEIRYQCINGAGVNTNLFVSWRIFIFQYLADGSVANKPIISDFLQTNPANAGTTYGAYSNYDIDYDRMYTMLWDSQVLGTNGNHGVAVTGSSALGENKVGNKSIPLSRADRNIQYFTGATTGFNHIYLLVTTDSATIAGNPLFSFSSEFRFTDS